MPRLALILALFVSAPLSAQDPVAPEITQQLDARVIARESGLLRIDIGSESGVAVGDSVQFLPRGLAPVEAVVQQVGPRFALVEPLRLSVIEIGTRAKVTVAFQAEEGRPPHPGWETPPDSWDESMPLLADVETVERPTLWRSRAFVGYDLYKDRERDGRAYSTLRSGFALDGWGIFDEDDILEIDVEYRLREIERIGSPDERDSQFRIDRFAYGKQSTRSRPDSWRVGRFLQSGLAEFGVLDGAEYAKAPWSGFGYGAAVGWRPRLYDDFDSFEDLQVSGHVRWTDTEGVAEASLGLQKTWDDGASDRDLALVDVAYRPRTGFYAYGTAWVDYYSSGERLDGSSGAELSQAFLGAGIRDREGDGLLLTWSRVSFPLVSGDFGTLPPLGDPLEFRNDRLRLDGWQRLSQRWRAGASAWAWDDQSESGGGGELRLDGSGYANGFGFGGALFTDQGLYTDVLGLRLYSRFTTSAGLLSLTWTGRDFESAVPGGGGSTEGLHHAARIGLDSELGAGWSLSLWTQLDEGAEQGAIQGGFWLQRRS